MLDQTASSRFNGCQFLPHLWLEDRRCLGRLCPFWLADQWLLWKIIWSWRSDSSNANLSALWYAATKRLIPICSGGTGNVGTGRQPRVRSQFWSIVCPDGIIGALQYEKAKSYDLARVCGLFTGINWTLFKEITGSLLPQNHDFDWSLSRKARNRSGRHSRCDQT